MRKSAAAAAIIFGNFLYALTVKLFLLPAELVTGGSTGVALAVSHLLDVPLSHFVLFFNTSLLILGLVVLGKAFALTTLASTFLYPFFLDLCDRLFGSLVLTEDIFLCTVFSGAGIGIALGCIIRAGASSGGISILSLVLHKWLRVSVSTCLYCLDFCVLLLQTMFRPAENVLYGIVLVLIYTIVLDKLLLLGHSRTEVKIVSPHSQAICRAILTEVDRGVTLLSAEGGYLHQDMQLVLSVISNRELIKIERLVREIDPECFMVVSRVSEVRGHGFSSSKQYR